MKTCRTCQRELPESEFHVRENGRLRNECRRCVLERVYRWRRKNPEKLSAQRKRRDRSRYYEQANARRRAKSNSGVAFTANCKRCNSEFEYVLVRKHRTVCDLCRKHDNEWRDFRLTGPEAAELRSRNACDICGETENPGGRFNEFHIDHCHDTNRVRGLLCAKCNTVLGLMGNDPARLRSAADYLEAPHDEGSREARAASPG